MNVGAIVGGIGFGIWSETIGRRRAIVYACLLALPVLPLWAFTATPLLLGAGAFLMQVAVQGARSEEHTSELQSLMRISYAVFCLKKKKLQILTITLIVQISVQNHV